MRTFSQPGQKAGSPAPLAGFAAHPLVLAGAWVACVLVLHAIVAAVHYPLRDPDSTLYESISEQLSRRPVREWIAPLFPPARFKEGFFLEHLAAFFWPAAALGKLGFARGALLANFLYFLGSLYLLFRLAATLADRAVGWVAVGSYLFSPLGIQYLLRANHENAWGLAYFGGFWCLHEMPRSRWFGLGFALFGLFAFAMKGVLGLSFWPVMLLWWVMVSGRRKDAVWFALGAVFILLFSGLYQLAYRRVTGQSFLAGYLGTQIGYVSLYEQRPVWGKLLNPFYYLAHVLWFSLPGSALAAWGMWRSRRRAEPFTAAQKLVVGGSGGIVALLSLMTRRAARYIFPAYALVHVPGAETLLRHLPRLRGFLERREAWLPYLVMASLLVVLPLRIMVDQRFYRFIRVIE